MEAAANVQTLVLNTLPPALGRTSIEPDEDLLAEGKLDSISLMELVSALEEDFGISIGDEDLVAENFRTIRDIENLVQAKQQGATA